eukprot:IDg11393t1
MISSYVAPYRMEDAALKSRAPSEKTNALHCYFKTGQNALGHLRPYVRRRCKISAITLSGPRAAAPLHKSRETDCTA